MQVGKSKYGPVELIIVGRNQLRVLKRVSKVSLDTSKRVSYIFNEKKILQMFKEKELDFIVKLCQTFTDENDVCFVFEFLEGHDLAHLILN